MGVSKAFLAQRQSLPLEAKVAMSQRRIREWYDHFDSDVYVSISGGKDSMVLLDLVRSTPGVWDVPAVYCDTGLEYPEVRALALKHADEVIRPNLTFKQVLERYGYPVATKEQAQYVREYRHGTPKMRDLRWNGRGDGGSYAISKRWRYLVDAPFEVSEKCCDVMKKRPFKRYERSTGRRPYLGIMAEESSLRRQRYMQTGCNAYEARRQASTPMGFWTEQDVLAYTRARALPLAEVYGEIVDDGGELALTGCKRTGCMFCCFGVCDEQRPNRFERMRETHPRQYDYCMGKLGLAAVLDYMGVAR